MPKIQQERLEGRLYNIGYKVVTADMESLGLRKNPNIITFPFNQWYRPIDDKIESGKGDWGGIWLARTKGSAKALSRYMQSKHSKETRIFKATLGEILCFNDYRIKTNGLRLYKELFLQS